MNPSAIPSTSPAASAPPKRFSPAESSASDEPFGQVLSREMADKSSAANTEGNAVKDTDAPAKAANPGESPKTGQSDSVDKAGLTAPDAVVAGSLAAEQMLMMAAQIVRSPTLPATVSAEALPQSGQARMDAAMLAGFAPDIAKAETNDTLASRPGGVHEGGERPDFEQALGRMLNQAQNAKPANLNGDASILPPAADTAATGKLTGVDVNSLTAKPFADADAVAETSQESNRAIAASMAPVQQAAAHQAPAVKTGADRIAPYVGTPAWDKAIGQRVVWMISAEQQSASLTLNPPDLGPLQVVLNISSTQANASFYAAQPEVRQAIEAALPKLREMLGDAGIQLGQANVSAGTPQQQDAYSGAPAQLLSSQAVPSASLNATPAVTETRRIVRDGLIDTFA